jgi:hypothetical protein
MVPAADEVHAVLTVDGDARHVPVSVTLGQLLPSLDDGILDLFDGAIWFSLPDRSDRLHGSRS